MTLHFDPAPAAARLAQAKRTHHHFDALPAHERPTSLAQGYAVQDAFRAAAGEEVGGYKVAAANAAALRTSEFGLALFGYMGRTHMHGNAAVVQRVEGAPFTLEVEVAFKLACDVNPARESLDCHRMLASSFLAFEIVCSRYVDRKVVGAPSFVADDSAFHAFVRGDALPGVDASALWTTPASLIHGGASITPALSGDACTDPLRSLALFWEHAATYNLSLKRGQVITTGTLVQAVDVQAPGKYEGRLGDARVVFTLV